MHRVLDNSVNAANTSSKFVGRIELFGACILSLAQYGPPLFGISI